MSVNLKTVVYTDASYSKEHKIAVIGFVKGFEESLGGIDSGTSELMLKTDVIKEGNNTRAELRAAIFGLKSCAKESKVILYSDSSAVTELLKRRERLEGQCFMSKKTGQILNNADLYKEFYLLIDELDIEINWVKGHSPREDYDVIASNFSYLDKSVRKELRLSIESIGK